MLDNRKIAGFITAKRKQIGMTQGEVAEKLNVSFQAVSKWENGTLPNVELLAAASNGLHTNGYSFVRMLMLKMPQMKLSRADGETFIEQIMKPHTPYYRDVKNIFSCKGVHGRLISVYLGKIPAFFCDIW